MCFGYIWPAAGRCVGSRSGTKGACGVGAIGCQLLAPRVGMPHVQLRFVQAWQAKKKL